MKKNGKAVQTAKDPCQLLADARRVKPVYDAFIAAVASKSAGHALHAKLNGRYRIGEKMVLRPPAEQERFPGACRVRNVVRGAVVYSRMSKLAAGFHLIAGCDAKTSEDVYTAADAAGLTTKINLRGILWAWWLDESVDLFAYVMRAQRTGQRVIVFVSCHFRCQEPIREADHGRLVRVTVAWHRTDQR